MTYLETIQRFTLESFSKDARLKVAPGVLTTSLSKWRAYATTDETGEPDFRRVVITAQRCSSMNFSYTGLLEIISFMFQSEWSYDHNLNEVIKENQCPS